jgi:hypothetical protein
MQFSALLLLLCHTLELQILRRDFLIESAGSRM